MIIYRHLLKELYLTLMLVTLVAIAIFSVNQLVMYLKAASIGRLTIMAVIKLMILEMPLLLGFLLPLGLYLAIMLVLGRWCAANEMTVLSACGFSTMRLTIQVFSLSTVIAGIVFVLMFIVNPVLETAQSYWRVHTIEEVSLQKVLPGSFRTFGDGRVFYANKVSMDRKKLSDVMLIQKTGLSSSGLPKWDVTYANSATQGAYLNYPEPFILFHGGLRAQVSAGSTSLYLTRYSQYGLMMPGFNYRVDTWPDRGGFLQLLHAPEKDLAAHALFQWRLSLVISVFILSLAAIPLSYVPPRKSRYGRFFIAIVFYIAYTNTLYMMRFWLQSGQLPLGLGAWWVHAAGLVIALTMWGFQYGLPHSWRRESSACEK